MISSKPTFGEESLWFAIPHAEIIATVRFANATDSQGQAPLRELFKGFDSVSKLGK